MATFKLGFVFQAGSTGWTENYYRDRTTAELAASFAPTFWLRFFWIRGGSVVGTGMRVGDPTLARSGTLVKVDRRRSTTGDPRRVSGGPVQVAAELAARSAMPSRRTVLARGLKDLAYIRDSSGVYTPTARTVEDFEFFAEALTDHGLQLRHLTPNTLVTTDKPLVALAAGGGGATTVASCNPLVLPNVGDRVIFHRLPSNLFPGLRGEVPVIATDAAGTFTMPVRWTGPSNSVITPGGVFRQPHYQYGNITSAPLADIRARRTGRPLTLSRGRKSAVRYRPR